MTKVNGINCSTPRKVSLLKLLALNWSPPIEVKSQSVGIYLWTLHCGVYIALFGGFRKLTDLISSLSRTPKASD